MNFENIKKEFEKNADRDNAVSMARYMKNNFEFYGIQAPKRKDIEKPFIKHAKTNKNIEWNLLDLCYEDKHRELQYFVYDYLLGVKEYVCFEDIPKIREYIITKSWWDTIDFLCKVIGNIGLQDKRVKKLMIDWSKDENIWIKRTAIEHQLGLKEKTDTELLAEIIKNNFGSKEFFINKAIGWALRDYSKINPEWVRNFINDNKDKMDNLSLKEASKYI